MRTTMENSNKDFIPLSVELLQLKEYLQLEKMRFAEKFDYTIDIDQNLDTDSTQIPNMLIQPQLENAIWHGLRYKNKKGYVSLKIFRNYESLIIKIEDNGIGIKRSQELKTEHQKQHVSRGMTNTRERISLLNSLYHSNISLEISEKEGNESGVIVIIKV
jgi:LytS/YehU family sensor histidine kinase